MAAALGPAARRVLALGRVPQTKDAAGVCLGPLAAAGFALAGLAATSRPGAQPPAPWLGSTGPAARCEAAATPALGPPPGFDAVEEMPQGLDLKKSEVRLYQFESCPFCRKVRACLDYHRIPYEIIEVHPLSKAEAKFIAPDYRKVPILRVDVAEGRGFRIIDSKTIVRAMLGGKAPAVMAKVPPPAATPATAKMWPGEEAAGSVEAQWISWTDKVLVQCIVLNVYRTMDESAETFRYLLTHPNFSWYEKRSAAWSGTFVMWAVAKARKRKFGVPEERAALYEAVDLFADAVKSGGGPFMSGKKPGVVDFNVYGILRSAEGCETERDISEKCPKVHAWLAAMNEVVGSSCAKNKGDVKRGEE